MRCETAQVMGCTVALIHIGGGDEWLHGDGTQVPAGRGGTPSCLLLIFASQILALILRLKSDFLFCVTLLQPICQSYVGRGGSEDQWTQ